VIASPQTGSINNTQGGTGAGSAAVIDAVGFNQTATTPWTTATMNVQFLTPSLDVPLPPKSVVPYMEFPRYITQSQNGPIPAYGAQGSVAQLQSQTITLPQIPDLLIVYVKATQVAGAPDPQDNTIGDCYLPIAGQYNSTVRNPLSINFDNFSGLLSSHTSEQLYQMSVSNGLEMPFPQWSGLVRSEVKTANGATLQAGAGSTPVAPFYPAGGLRPTTGGFLVLKPSKDITLQPGQAPSLVGNFTLQFNLTVVNTFPYAVQPTLFVITANSGFFESIRGSSRIIKGVLSEQDIISAPVSSAQTHEGLKRLVGGKVSFGSLANVFHRAKESYDRTKPADSKMGSGTGAGDGCGTGAGKRKGLSARLM
jgi:hypothetical protein